MPWTAADWANATAGEVGELAEVVLAIVAASGKAGNVVKKIRRHETGARNDGDPSMEELQAEAAKALADVVIYTDLLAAFLHVDLGQAVIEKFNRTSEKYGFPERLGTADNVVSVRDPVCHDDVGGGNRVYDDRPRPGASPEADERSETFGNDRREVAYLEANGWKKATTAGDGRRETWAINWEFRQSRWPKAVLQKHGNATVQVWTRQEALNVHREIDWFKGV